MRPAVGSRRKFDSERFGPAHWLDDRTYITIEASTTVAGAQDIVRYAAAKGERSVMVGAELLVPPFRNGEPLTIEAYKFSPDGHLVLVFTNSNLRTQVITCLTHDGSDTLANGAFDWVYEEELSLRDGFRWRSGPASPDGSRTGSPGRGRTTRSYRSRKGWSSKGPCRRLGQSAAG